MLKEMTTKSMGAFADYEQLLLDMRSGMRLLELTYSTFGVISPRKGDLGAFLKVESLPSISFELGTSFYDSVHKESGCLLCIIATGDLLFAVDKDGVANGEDVLASLQRLEENLNRFKRAQDQFAVCFQSAMAPCRIPSKLRQRYVKLTSSYNVSSGLVTYSIYI